MDTNSIKHVFFDLDHTLWDFDTNSKLAFEKILPIYFPDLSIELFSTIYAPINQAYWEKYQVNEITHSQLRYMRLKDTFEVLNIFVTDTIINEISQKYIQELPNYNHLLPNCKNTLSYLSKKYQLHIITNGLIETQKKKMDNASITTFFKTITHSQTVGVKKPNPNIYAAALLGAGATKTQSIMIGDCIQADVKGALDFGIRAIFFNPTNKNIPLNIIQITNLATLKQIL